MSSESKRYQVRDGSESSHCCFLATVVDTTKPYGNARRHETVCECFEYEHAQMIADALNARTNVVTVTIDAQQVCERIDEIVSATLKTKGGV